MSAKLRATGFSSSSGADAAFDSFYFSSDSTAADEAEVAGVLFRLPDLIRKFESSRRFPPCWGAKRRRSVIEAPPELLPVNGKLEYVSSSPTSPLTFSSHADLDTKHVVSNKEIAPSGFKRENEWLKDCGRSTVSGDQLTGSMSDDEIKTMSFKQKVRNPDLSCGRKMPENMKLQEVHESVSCISESLELQLFSRSQPLVHHRNHQPLGMLQFQQEMGPRGIPDLNVPAEEYAGGMDWRPPPQLSENHYYMAAAVESRAEAAALARQRRHLIQKSKRATRGSR